MKCQPEEIEEIKNKISNKLSGYFHKHDLAKEINPEWIKAENSPIKLISEQDYMLIKVGPEPKKM